MKKTLIFLVCLFLVGCISEGPGFMVTFTPVPVNTFVGEVTETYPAVTATEIVPETPEPDRIPTPTQLGEPAIIDITPIGDPQVEGYWGVDLLDGYTVNLRACPATFCNIVGSVSYEDNPIVIYCMLDDRFDENLWASPDPDCYGDSDNATWFVLRFGEEFYGELRKFN